MSSFLIVALIASNVAVLSFALYLRVQVAATRKLVDKHERMATMVSTHLDFPVTTHAQVCADNGLDKLEIFMPSQYPGEAREEIPLSSPRPRTPRGTRPLPSARGDRQGASL